MSKSRAIALPSQGADGNGLAQHGELPQPLDSELALHPNTGVPTLGMRNLVTQDACQMPFGIEIVDEPGVHVNEPPGCAESVEDIVIVNDLYVVIGEKVGVMDVG